MRFFFGSGQSCAAGEARDWRSMTYALLEQRLVRCWVTVLYSSNPVDEPIGWLPMNYRIEYKLLVIVFRSLLDRMPDMYQLLFI